MNGGSTNNHNSKIISVSILHRHGSRGPGESELTPWQPDSPIKLQWAPSDLENITSIGHKQCLALGEWFSSYISHNNVRHDSERIFWRCSKSGRAKESGVDFIKGFNTSRSKAISEKPIPYAENADNYFRPWKVVPDFSDTIKKRMANDNNWAQKAQENIELLKRAFTKADAESILSKPTKALWSTTYLYCARECELFWPSDEGYRGVLNSLLDEKEWDEITKLACWVWEERFVRSGYITAMGGKLLREVLTQSWNTEFSVNIYSGHDYTILAVLALLGVIPSINRPASFACYILFELWDGPPPPRLSTKIVHVAADVSLSSDKRILRVLFNSEPFVHHENGDKLVVHVENEEVYGEFSMSEVQSLMNTVDEHFNDNNHHQSSMEEKAVEREEGRVEGGGLVSLGLGEGTIVPMSSSLSLISEVDEHVGIDLLS